MAILRVKEVRELSGQSFDSKLEELTLELNSERGTVASGGKAVNAGRIRELRRTIARMLTIQNEVARKAKAKGKPAEKKPAKAKAAGKKEKS